jgi:SAM-dependent methyltransferase
VLQSRLNDFLAGVRDPRGNERLALVKNLLKSRDLKIDSPGGYEQAKAFVVENLMRVKQQQSAFRQRLENPAPESGQKTHEGVFRDRGIALDTKILSSFGMSAALRDMKNRGAVSEGAINRVAVIGPGLDFTDKGFGYDFYPLQTLQPFAIYDSLVQLGLAKAGKIDIVAFDISSEVLDHLRGARERAKRGEGYVVQLPRESRPWVSDAIEYWRSFGSAIGEAVTPIQPPPALKDLETRAVRIRPDVVLSCKPVDLNFVLEQAGPPGDEQFDVVIATNVFVYYDALEQALALQNISALLKPGGFLLTNEPLQALSEIPMKAVEYTLVQYGQGEFERDKIFWWQRQ